MCYDQFVLLRDCLRDKNHPIPWAVVNEIKQDDVYGQNDDCRIGSFVNGSKGVEVLLWRTGRRHNARLPIDSTSEVTARSHNLSADTVFQRVDLIEKELRSTMVY
jgi:hypothetical protein